MATIMSSVPLPLENHLHAIIIMLLKLFFRAMEYIFLIECAYQHKIQQSIKRCPTAFSYWNIDIDLSNLLNIICQKSLIKNSNTSHF